MHFHYGIICWLPLAPHLYTKTRQNARTFDRKYITLQAVLDIQNSTK